METGLDQEIRLFVSESRDNEAIKIKSLLSVFYSGRWLVLAIVFVFFVFGVLWGISTPKEFTTTSKVLTEENDGLSNNMGLGNLSALVGINSRNVATIETLTPDLYPAIVTNSDFLLELAREKYYFRELDTNISLVTFFSDFEKENWIKYGVKQIFNLPSKLLNKTPDIQLDTVNTNQLSTTVLDGDSTNKNSQILSIAAPEIMALSKLQKRITVSKVNKIIELSTEMPDADVSAILNKKIIDYLINYVTKYKTDKERQNNIFIQNQLKEAEDQFNKNQNALASYLDANIGIIREKDKSVVQKLQTELRLSTEVYTNLSQQLELSKLKLEQSKPILTIFENPKRPIAPSSTSTFGAVLAFIVLGFFLSITLICGKIFWEFFKQAK
ncbi:Chain length determinant protein [Parapedobacter luteus]|uniref:Chain length determinant protein n=1 Tax=Parapedobacter luteus TaxID=623280 RepID=A0A1T5DGE9_9SPHI|nr:Wzz/FepE/Etk N-terminal domain-containing protein [Parapedobacter luteus]SKB70651.1 Chain length determinant protein [Parapedobacter luteus]